MTHQYLKSIISFIFYLLLSSNAYAEFLSLSESTSLTGNFTQGGIVIGQTLAENQVIFDDIKLQVSSEGDFVFGFKREEAKTVSLKIISADGLILSRLLNIKQRSYDIQRIDGLPDAKVSPKKPEVLQRIRDEAKQVANARLRDDTRLDFKEDFIWPSTGRISGVYGSQRILNG